MTVYEGKRASMVGMASMQTREVPLVTVDGNSFDARRDLKNHSPDGFEWGYNGSGPSQLALAILAHYLKDDQKALRLYQDFKWDFVAMFDYAGWRLTSQEIDDWLEDREKDDGKEK